MTSPFRVRSESLPRKRKPPVLRTEGLGLAVDGGYEKWTQPTDLVVSYSE